MAMLEVTAPSAAFKVDTFGCDPAPDQRVRKFSGPDGTTVAFST
jgi:hypothetical protein